MGRSGIILNVFFALFFLKVQLLPLSKSDSDANEQFPVPDDFVDFFASGSQMTGNPRNVHFYLYGGKGKPNRVKEIFAYGKPKTLKSVSSLRNKTVYIYTHRFRSNATSGGCSELKSAYLYRGIVEIICVDWSKRSFGNPGAETVLGEASIIVTYPIAVKNTVTVGKRLAEFMQFLVTKKVVSNFGNFHLVGTSLGAHISGIAGKMIRQKNNTHTVGRITGLDPAGPLYQVVPKEYSLSPSSAEYVEVLHTDTTTFGISHSLGHADFYMNGGSKQPGCPVLSAASIGNTTALLCNHYTSVDDYERLILGEEFKGCKCKEGPIGEGSTPCQKPRKCEGQFAVTISSKHRGNFYLPVSATPPPGIREHFISFAKPV